MRASTFRNAITRTSPPRCCAAPGGGFRAPEVYGLPGGHLPPWSWSRPGDAGGFAAPGRPGYGGVPPLAPGAAYAAVAGDGRPPAAPGVPPGAPPPPRPPAPKRGSMDQDSLMTRVTHGVKHGFKHGPATAPLPVPRPKGVEAATDEDDAWSPQTAMTLIDRQLPLGAILMGPGMAPDDDFLGLGMSEEPLDMGPLDMDPPGMQLDLNDMF